MTEDEDLWIFGYGSLLWRPSFPFAARRQGWVEGWARRFWQGSTDHRGTPSAPGRVVTLVELPGERCWGLAYRIAAMDRDRVLEELDLRERGGYSRVQLVVHPAEDAPFSALTYVATPENPEYVGPAPEAAIARTIAASYGPSGSNLEYVLRLEDALRQWGAEDPHVFELARHLRRLQALDQA